MFRIKRTYDAPVRGDGRRILVERLWPRGMKKEDLDADAWMEEVAPSTRLRQWFGHETDRWEEFRRRYRKELDANPAAWEPLLDAGRRHTVTLLYSAHDVVHNSAVVLRDYLMERQVGGSRRAKVSGHEPTSRISRKRPSANERFGSSTERRAGK